MSYEIRQATLIDDLEEAARRIDCPCGHKMCERAPLASRLRAAAVRLREEDAKLAKKMYNAQQGGDERGETVAWFARDTLRRINGGPLNHAPTSASGTKETSE